MTVRVIVDCDNTMGGAFKEVDDGLTLLYLLGRPDVEILGITTTFGNGPIDDVYELTKDFLRKVGRADIPLFKGAGERGQPPTEAAHFLAEVAADDPGEVTVLALGPMGNLRAASEVDPAFFRNTKHVSCMGGYLHPLRLGWKRVDELNLASDSEAAFTVLRSGCPITLMNAHICQQASFGWGDLARVRQWGRSTRGAIRRWLIGHAVACGLGKFYLWDLLPAVYLSHPELFDATRVWVRSTETDLETGSIILGAPGEGAAIHMPERILDVARFREVLFSAWGKVPID
jgi:inosine-uridine nucleoside N-ribohydrolase